MKTKIDWTSFFSNIIAVILGIFITFGIQGLIDRSNERKEIKSALGLVKQELLKNKSDVQEMISIIGEEKQAAEYLLHNNDRLDSCPMDSLEIFATVISNDMIATITDDALELMKSSSLFQKIDNNALSLSIIKAYDYLSANSQVFNMHEDFKITLVNDLNSDRIKALSLAGDARKYIEELFSSNEAKYSLTSLIGMANYSFLEEGCTMIDDTISEIDRFLAGK